MIRKLPPAPAGLLRALAAEPLVHFLMIGVVVFALDRALSPTKVDPRLIEVDAAAYGEIVDIFADVNARPPTPEEMAPLVERWIQEQTLYREARALSLEEGDDMVRERVIQKMRVLLHSAVTTDLPDEATARAWFEQNRDRYAAPPVLSLRVAQVDGDEDAARGWAEKLNAMEEAGAVPQPHEIRVIPFANRPEAQLRGLMGDAFVDGALALPRGRWGAVASPAGWQAARVEAYEIGRVATYEEVAGAVGADWKEATYRRAVRQSLDQLMASYRIERAPYDPAAFEARAAVAAEAAAARDAAQR